MLPTKFRFIWPGGFRGEEFKKIDQSETRIACGGPVCSWIEMECAIFIKDLLIDASNHVSVHLAKQFQRRRYFRYQPIRNNNCLWRPCLLTDQDKISTLNRGLPIDASYQVLVHLAKRLQRRRLFRNQPIRNKNCLWWPCLLMDQDKMCNLLRGPSIDASYQVSVHFGQAVSEEKICLNRQIRNKNCLWQPCLFTNRNEVVCNLYRGPSIDVSYQVSVHLAKWF
jgi:Zn-finger protein